MCHPEVPTGTKPPGALSAAVVEPEFQVYPGLGHGFLKASLDDESAPGYRQACESWTRTIAFFREAFATVATRR